MAAIDSSQVIKLMSKCWTIGGVIPTEKFKYGFVVYSIVVSANVILFLPFAVLLNIFEHRDLDSIGDTVGVQLAVVVYFFKQITIFYGKKNVRNIIEILEILDQRLKTNDESIIIGDCGKLCKRIFFVWCALDFMTLYTYTAARLYGGYYMIFPQWFPLDMDIERNAWMAFLYQMIALPLICLQTVLNDSFPVISLTLLGAHIEALAVRIQQIGKTSSDSSVTYNNLVACIEDHITIFRLFEEISAVVRRTMTVQYCFTAISLCLEAVNIFFIATTLFQKITHFLVIAVYILQIFPSCYCMNRVIAINARLTGAMFDCHWVVQDAKFRKALLIYMQWSQQDFVILMAKVKPINLSTFIEIIQFSFSMYTVLSTLNN